jgi:hypothetical protein
MAARSVACGSSEAGDDVERRRAAGYGTSLAAAGGGSITGVCQCSEGGSSLRASVLLGSLRAGRICRLTAVNQATIRRRRGMHGPPHSHFAFLFGAVVCLRSGAVIHVDDKGNCPMENCCCIEHSRKQETDNQFHPNTLFVKSLRQVRSGLGCDRFQKAAENLATDRQGWIICVPGVGISGPREVGLLEPERTGRLSFLLCGRTAAQKRGKNARTISFLTTDAHNGSACDRSQFSHRQAHGGQLAQDREISRLVASPNVMA